jgi:hypothetical protein
LVGIAFDPRVNQPTTPELGMNDELF